MTSPRSALAPSQPLAIWLPLLAGLIAYLAVLGGGFVWDDKHLVVDSTLIRQPSPLPLLTSDFWQEGERSGFYRPLVSLSYYLEFQLWHLSPAGYHAANLTYHLLATLAVTWVAWLLFASPVAMAVAGIAFAVHPIHTESVAFISGRPDLLAAAFLAGSLALFLRARRLDRQVSAGSVALFGGALLCKETAIALPAILIAAELTLAHGAGESPGSEASPFAPRWGQIALRLAPYLGTMGAYLGLRWAVLGAPLAASGGGAGFGVGAVIALNAFGDYLRLLFVPYPAAPERFPDASFSGQSLAVLVVLAALVATVAWNWKRSRMPAFLVGWFILTLLPASPLLPGRAPQVAERFLYVPSAALAWLAGWASIAIWTSAWLRSPARRRALVAAGVALVASSAGLTALRSLDWRDEYHLFSRMAASEPRSYLAPLNLGHLHVQSGDTARAEREFLRALQIRPDSPPALLGLALVQSRQGDNELAIRYAERARDLAPRGDLVHAQLGTIYGVAGRHLDAAESFREAIRRNPRRFHPRANLVVALAEAGKRPEAAAALAETERLLAAESYRDPGDVQRVAWLRERLERMPVPR